MLNYWRIPSIYDIIIHFYKKITRLDYMKFCYITLGCKVNQYETQAIERILTERGHIGAKIGAGCDVCIINTCAVTAESVRKSRQAIRRAKKSEPGALVAVCGCLSQLDPSEIETLGVDVVGGSGGKLEFVSAIEQRLKDMLSQLGETNRQETDRLHETNAIDTLMHTHAAGICSSPKNGNSQPARNAEFEELAPGTSADRTRGLLKIQDGCDNYCAYCIIPYARGHARSLPRARAIEFASSLAGQGYREIVVTGIEISAYGKDFAPVSASVPARAPLLDVVRDISDAAPNARLRLGSLDPGILSDSFCRELSAISSICNHFHLSLQSGCDATLQRMGRKYNTADTLRSIALLRELFPGCAIAADLIVGFPGERDAEFDETLRFIKAANFAFMHIFPFSPRPGTAAANMPMQIPLDICRARASAASAIASEMSASFREAQVGKTLDVLFERERCGYWYGHSSNYVEVAARGAIERNMLLPIHITHANPQSLPPLIFGEMLVQNAT